jgi:hypothetical protein
MKKIIYFLVLLSVVMSGCKSKLKTRELGAYSYKISCLGEQNNKLLVNTWGKGLSYDECRKEALKSAVRDVIFKGIQDGNVNCKKPAILTTPNAEKNYNRFFELFFSDKGQYQNYVSYYDEPRSQNHSKKIRKTDRVLNMALEFQVLVDRDGLVKQLQEQIVHPYCS